MDSFLTPYGLSNSGEKKLQFTPFWLLRQPLYRNYRKPWLFCLRSYPGEISHSNSPHRQLSNDLSDVVVRRRKVALHTSSHLTPTEAWRSPDSTTSEGRRVSSEVRLGNCTQVWGWAKFEERGSHRQGKIALHTCSDLPRLVRTYNTVTMYARLAMSFFCTFERSYSSVLRPIQVQLHILTRLIDSFPMVHGSWSCIEIEMLIPPGAHA